jgi:hypothetical protein
VVGTPILLCVSARKTLDPQIYFAEVKARVLELEIEV